MSTLSQFAPFTSGGLKSYQTGYVSSGVTNGTGEDSRFFDVTVSSVNTSKTITSFDGSGTGGGGNDAMSYFSSTAAQIFIFAGRMTSATNLRLSTSTGFAVNNLRGRWQIAEAN